MNVKELKAKLYSYGDDVEVVLQVQSLEPMPVGSGHYWASDYYDIVDADFERSDDGPGTLFLMTEGG